MNMENPKGSFEQEVNDHKTTSEADEINISNEVLQDSKTNNNEARDKSNLTNVDSSEKEKQDQTNAKKLIESSTDADEKNISSNDIISPQSHIESIVEKILYLDLDDKYISF